MTEHLKRDRTNFDPKMLLEHVAEGLRTHGDALDGPVEELGTREAQACWLRSQADTIEEAIANLLCGAAIAGSGRCNKLRGHDGGHRHYSRAGGK